MSLDLSWNVILYGCNVIKLGYIKKLTKLEHKDIVLLYLNTNNFF